MLFVDPVQASAGIQSESPKANAITAGDGEASMGMPRWLGNANFAASLLNYLSWKEQNHSFQALGAIGGNTYTLTGNGGDLIVADQTV